MTATTDDTAVLEAGLARAVEQLGEPAAGGSDGAATVTVIGTASVGANRRTLFVEVHRAGQIVPAVVQIAPVGFNEVSLGVEATCIRLAADAGVPVADPLAASDDPSYVGESFHMSRRVDGVTVPRHILRAVEKDPGLGTTIARQCGEGLARLHGIDADRIPAGVARWTDPTPTVSYLRRLNERAAQLPPSPAVALGLRWMARHHPGPPAAPSLVHSDLRNGNIIVDDGGLAAIIDWELCHVGDPMEDLAWLCLRCWRYRNDHLEVGGFGDRATLRAAYESAGGTWRDDAFRWWKVARSIWWCQGLMAQSAAFSSGRSSSLVLAASGRRVAELEYDLLGLIGPDGG